MNINLPIRTCAVVAAAFVFGYESHKWRHPQAELDHFTARKDAIVAQVHQHPFFDYTIIGDSITEHAYIPSLCGKSVLNAGIGGAEIRDAETLMAELAPILKTDKIILAVGVNDTRRGDAKQTDFERLVRVAKAMGAEVFAATISPVDAAKPDGAARDPALIDAINAQIRSSVEASHLIDMGASMKAEETKDGVHLTEAGARKWGNAIEGTVCRPHGSDSRVFSSARP
jgi:hypothetical protein